MMSKVFLARNANSNFILHTILLTPEHTHRNFPLVLSLLKRYFFQWQHTLTPRYHSIELTSNTLLTLQDYIPGENAWIRSVREGIISDEFSVWNTQRYFEQLLLFLSELHQRKASGSGYIENIGDGFLIGKSPSWKYFLESESRNWCEQLNLPHDSKRKIIKLIDSLPENLETSLIHGDTINPSNIRVQEENIVWVIDWEWSLLADPAWEFADLWWEKVIERTRLDTYFRASGIMGKKERNDFLERVEKYHILWLLWWSALHVLDENPNLSTLLFTELIARIKKIS